MKLIYRCCASARNRTSKRKRSSRRPPSRDRGLHYLFNCYSRRQHKGWETIQDAIDRYTNRLFTYKRHVEEGDPSLLGSIPSHDIRRLLELVRLIERRAEVESLEGCVVPELDSLLIDLRSIAEQLRAVHPARTDPALRMLDEMLGRLDVIMDILPDIAHRYPLDNPFPYGGRIPPYIAWSLGSADF